VTSADNARTYRFAPLDRGGWILGLGAGQCLLLASGLLAAGVALQVGLPTPVAVGAVAFVLVGAFGSWHGRSIHEWAPVLARFAVLRLSGAARWRAELPLLTGTAADARREPPLPPFLAGLAIVGVPGLSWCPATIATGVGVVRDRRAHTVSASVPVRGREFSLLERADQERALHQWGEVLAGFCAERGAVSRIRCTEWATATDLDEHLALAEARSGGLDSTPGRHYRQLLAEAAAHTVAHDLLVTVTVDPRRVRAQRRAGARAHEAAIDILGEELRLLSSRLDAAGLATGAPLSATQTAEAVRVRVDPAAQPVLRTRRRSLAELVGVVSGYNAGPLATDITWSALRCDGSWHRSFWIAEWPRFETGPGWLEPLLLHPGGTRTFALHYEPVPPSRSRRQIDRDATRLATDEEQRARTGFRIGAHHRRAQTAVAEREAELVAGYAELAYAGFLTVSAADREALDRSCAEYEQAAARAGLELRALDGRHETGLVCALPIGRGLVERWSR